MTDEDLTPKEQAVIDMVAERKGKEWIEDHSKRILTPARWVCELPPKPKSENNEE